MDYRFTFPNTDGGSTHVRITDEGGRLQTLITDGLARPVTDLREIERVTKLVLKEIGRARSHLWHEVLGRSKP